MVPSCCLHIVVHTHTTERSPNALFQSIPFTFVRTLKGEIADGVEESEEKEKFSPLFWL